MFSPPQSIAICFARKSNKEIIADSGNDIDI
jgi:hypothetical protein